MKTSTKYSVSDAATLYKKSRATLYKDIKNGGGVLKSMLTLNETIIDVKEG